MCLVSPATISPKSTSAGSAWRMQLHGGGQQELGGGGVEFPQHTAELAAGGQGALDIEAVGHGRIRAEREAEEPDQGGVLDQVAAQVPHGA